MPTTPIKSNPGIKRDGTLFDGDFYSDGQWVRFQNGRPRKMGGYLFTGTTLLETCRGLSSFTNYERIMCHVGSATKLARVFVDEFYHGGAPFERTPATLTGSEYNQWMFDYMYDSSSSLNSVIAHVSQNLRCICNDTGGQIFIGDINGSSALSEIALPAGANASGGIVVIHPYLFYYGSAGIIGWSVAGEPTQLNDVSNGSGIARVWGQKIVKGLPMRGAGSGPAGIFFAEDAIIRATFTGGATVFQFDVLSTNSSILSENAVVDYDGVFYWAGVDRFLMFNGVVKEIPNPLNFNWFFDNLNVKQRAKVYALTNQKFGEIWWCYPRGDAEECTHAVILNVRENTWYDTELPSERVMGIYSKGLGKPLFVEDNNELWVHETGVDRRHRTEILPIKSFFVTSDLSMLLQGKTSSLGVTRIEPDFVQTGDMSVQIIGKANARAQEIEGPVKIFPDNAENKFEEVVSTKEQRRQLRFKFMSDTVGGDYQTGQVIANIEEGDSRNL